MNFCSWIVLPVLLALSLLDFSVCEIAKSRLTVVLILTPMLVLFSFRSDKNPDVL